MSDRLIVPPFERGELVSLAQGWAPREACALLLGTAGIVVGVVPIENVAAEPEESFELSPSGQAIAALVRASTRLRVGVFHSHTSGPAHPSSGDLRYGRAGDALLIYSVELDELRGFRLERGGELDRQRVRAVEIAVG